jgi:hypothetical protein
MNPPKRLKGVLPLSYLQQTGYRDLDHGIRPLAKLFYEAGLRPFSSCSGHGREAPCVVLRGGKREAIRAARVLQGGGYFEFKIAVQRWYSRTFPSTNGFS